MNFLADMLGIDPSTLSRKINNKTEFTASEIDILCRLLKISAKDRMAIFFAN
jgi:transcriptional regulator with XRE-family HTH domain